VKKTKTKFFLEVEYDPEVTDPEGLACAMDRLLKTALSIPDVLEEYGNPKFGEFLVLRGSQGERRQEGAAASDCDGAQG
jgi:hypothetical protein